MAPFRPFDPSMFDSPSKTTEIDPETVEAARHALPPSPVPSLSEEDSRPTYKRKLQFAMDDNLLEEVQHGPTVDNDHEHEPEKDDDTKHKDKIHKPENPVPPDTAIEPEFKTSERQRQTSREWHKKWISAGVPRVTKEDMNNDNVEEPSASGASPPDLAPLEPEPVSLEPLRNLHEARNRFVTEWIKTCGMPPSNERRDAANKAWMKSSERSNYLAGRKGVQK